MLSRLPTSRRRFFEVVKAIEQEAINSDGTGDGDDIEAAKISPLRISNTLDSK